MEIAPKKDYSNLVAGLLAILLVATILPLFILSFYNHPCWDVYFDTTLVQQKGFIGAQKWWYYNWSGRYFVSALLSLNPLVFNASWGYKLNTVVFLLGLMGSAYWLAGKLLVGYLKTYKIGISALFIFAFVAFMPNIGFGLFWQCSVYTILTPCIFTLLLLASVLGYYQSASKGLFAALACLLTIAIIGSYEISMVFIDVFVLVLIWLARQKKWSMSFPLILLAICILFTIVEIAAPGNTARGSMMFPNAHRLVFSIEKSIKWEAFLLSRWLLPMGFVLLLLFDLFSKWKFEESQIKSILIIPLGLSFVACLAIPLVNVFIYFWSTGIAPSQWYLNGIYFYFVTITMYFFLSAVVVIRKRYPNFNIAGYVKIPLYLIFLVAIVFRTNNITTSYNDLFSGNASAYNQERIERDNYLRTFKGDSCMVDSIKHIPHSVFFSEIPQDAKGSEGLGIAIKWLNDGYYNYYNKKYIGIKKR